jgi:DNA repair exonuclease SbcCD ATPase subunit
MSALTEKTAYLKGLLSGVNLEDVNDRKKMLNALIETLEEFAQEIERIDVMQANMQEQVNAIDEDLGTIEDEMYDEDDFEDEIEIACPHCEEIIAFTDDDINENDEVTCPVCGKVFEVEWECDCGGCDCGCEEENK